LLAKYFSLPVSMMGFDWKGDPSVICRSQRQTARIKAQCLYSQYLLRHPSSLSQSSNWASAKCIRAYGRWLFRQHASLCKDFPVSECLLEPNSPRFICLTGHHDAPKPTATRGIPPSSGSNHETKNEGV